jgi:hypothetical protein
MTTNKSTGNAPEEVFIAGRKTIKDWKAFQPTLLPGGDAKPWEKAGKDYFEARLASRYLTPIQTLQQIGSQRGEGFSIVAVQCSLIEFLESTNQGKSYRYRRDGAPPLGPYEYSNSGAIFESFLTNRPPFKSEFVTPQLAHDFYVSVRCGVLHEARTKNAWVIRAKHGSRIVDATGAQKILYRDGFQKALLDFVEWYKSALTSDLAIQQAFIRKFDSLCV